MLKLIFAVGLCLDFAPADAQTLQKCMGEGRAVAFRSGPCLPGETLAHRRDVSSDRPTPEALRQVQERQRREEIVRLELQRSNRPRSRTLHVVNARGHSASKASTCASAKRERKRGLEAYKGRASMKLHSDLNHMVYDACKG